MTAAEGRRAGVTGNAMDRFIDGIELAAAAFIGIVAIDIFVSVLLRYLFNASIPDSYDFGRLLLRDDIYGYSRKVRAALGLEG